MSDETRTVPTSADIEAIRHLERQLEEARGILIAVKNDGRVYPDTERRILAHFARQEAER